MGGKIIKVLCVSIGILALLGLAIVIILSRAGEVIAPVLMLTTIGSLICFVALFISIELHELRSKKEVMQKQAKEIS